MTLQKVTLIIHANLISVFINLTLVGVDCVIYLGKIAQKTIAFTLQFGYGVYIRVSKCTSNDFFLLSFKTYFVCLSVSVPANTYRSPTQKPHRILVILIKSKQLRGPNLFICALFYVFKIAFSASGKTDFTDFHDFNHP